MLTRIIKPRDDRDAGFTLIELLVVVAIIGILAAIAIPVFLSQRASARDASVKADLNGIAKVMETIYTEKGGYPTDTAKYATAALGEAAIADANAVTSPGNMIIVTAGAAPAKSFIITGCNAESANAFIYDSATGGLSPNAIPIGDTTCTTTYSAVAGEVAPPVIDAQIAPAP